MKRLIFKFLNESFNIETFVLLLFCFITNCSVMHSVQDIDKFRLIGNIPSRVQEKENTCGINSLYMAISYWDNTISYEDVSKYFKKQNDKGISTIEMLLVAKKLGYNAEIKKIDYNELLLRLKGEEPIILLIGNKPKVYERILEEKNVDLTTYHYVVAIGYSIDEKKILLNTGSKKMKCINNKDLESCWIVTDYTSVIVTKK
ncbi:MAG: C39 family peptidase [Candidatus Delongbacteria bacterium]|nr:C39 family peptidase [Candidatus Delongbacteria bacterium]